MKVNLMSCYLSLLATGGAGVVDCPAEGDGWGGVG